MVYYKEQTLDEFKKVIDIVLTNKDKKSLRRLQDASLDGQFVVEKDKLFNKCIKKVIDEVLENQKCLGILSFLEENKELRVFFDEHIGNVI
jgi:hypothetical protein